MTRTTPQWEAVSCSKTRSSQTVCLFAAIPSQRGSGLIPLSGFLEADEEGRYGGRGPPNQEYSSQSL